MPIYAGLGRERLMLRFLTVPRGLDVNPVGVVMLKDDLVDGEIIQMHQSLLEGRENIPIRNDISRQTQTMITRFHATHSLIYGGASIPRVNVKWPQKHPQRLKDRIRETDGVGLQGVRDLILKPCGGRNYFIPRKVVSSILS